MHSTIECSKSIAVSMVDTDLPLVNACRNGDVSAFEELIRRYDGKLYRLTQGITHNDADAEEVVQTAFLKAYQNLHRFQHNAKFSTWLIRIAMNEAFMKLRKQRSHKGQFLDSDTGMPDEGNNMRFHQHGVNLPDWAPSPESLYSATEFRQILEKSLQKLQPTLRVVFFLRDIEGHSISETSGILNLTDTTVKTRLSRARLQLREELTRYFRKPTPK